MPDGGVYRFARRVVFRNGDVFPQKIPADGKNEPHGVLVLPAFSGCI
ncbi:hypothetical protein AGMMS49525_16860 [Bacteroidia bacterium]|nr:hypothetical protein AGMMS49525_16860 [Bacteroidia bacterium]